MGGEGVRIIMKGIQIQRQEGRSDGLRGRRDGAKVAERAL